MCHFEEVKKFLEVRKFWEKQFRRYHRSKEDLKRLELEEMEKNKESEENKDNINFTDIEYDIEYDIELSKEQGIKLINLLAEIKLPYGVMYNKNDKIIKLITDSFVIKDYFD